MHNVFIQETIQVFDELDTLAREKPSEHRTKLIDLVLNSNLVELIQKMWRRDMREELLQENEEFPLYLHSSMHVIYVLYSRQRGIVVDI